ncbi:unnamed protein product [Ilex paraguariensis]|uniref:Lachrymatory-factor synthase n=1 Tax=Ilex paraguariensis TaxID=185542 RepID=A0ABC8UIR7_9AQUA
MEHEILPKWEAEFLTKLKKASADQIWPLFEDFFNLHKWFPGLSTCYGIHGTNGEPGCIRYCAGFSLPSQENNANGENPVSWSNERLVAVDPTQRSLSYEIVDCNIGFKSYSSKVRIIPGGDDGGDGCGIEWWITVDPVEGWKLEDLVKRYEVKLQLMAEKMEEDALRSSKKVLKMHFFSERAKKISSCNK